jgi:hypothetical protein
MVSDFTAGNGFIRAKIIRVMDISGDYKKMYTGILYVQSEDYNGNIVWEGAMNFVMLDDKGQLVEKFDVSAPSIILSGDKLIFNYEILLAKRQRIFIKK